MAGVGVTAQDIEREKDRLPMGWGRFGKEMTESTNVVLAATSKRLIVISTGMGGAPRKHHDLAWDGLQIAERKKQEFTLRTEAGEGRFRGAAKQMVPGFLDAIESKAG